MVIAAPRRFFSETKEDAKYFITFRAVAVGVRPINSEFCRQKINFCSQNARPSFFILPLNPQRGFGGQAPWLLILQWLVSFALSCSHGDKALKT